MDHQYLSHCIQISSKISQFRGFTLLFCTFQGGQKPLNQFEDEDGGLRPQDGEGDPEDGEGGPEDGAMIQLFQEQHEDFRYSHDLNYFFSK